MVEIKLSSPPLGYAEYNPSVSVYAGPQTVGTAAGNIFQLDVFHAPAFIGITFIVGAGGDLTDFGILAAARTGGTYVPWLSGRPLTAPAAPTLSQVAGGTITAATYFAKTWLNTPLGSTTPSTESSLAVSADYLLVAASPTGANGATTWGIGVSTATGTETIQANNIPIGTSWTEPTGGLIAGASLPPTNNINQLGTPSTLNPLTIASGGTFALPVPASSSFLVVLDTRAFESLIINATGGTATTLDFETSYYTVLPVNQ